MWSIWHSRDLITVLFLISVPVAGALGWAWARLPVRRGAPAWDVVAEAMVSAGTAPWAIPILAHNPNPGSTGRVSPGERWSGMRPDRG